MYNLAEVDINLSYVEQKYSQKKGGVGVVSLLLFQVAFILAPYLGIVRIAHLPFFACTYEVSPFHRAPHARQFFTSSSYRQGRIVSVPGP